MISNQVIINCIEEAKAISQIDMMLVDPVGITVVSTSDFSDIKKNDISQFVESLADTQTMGQYSFIKVNGQDEELAYVLVIKGIEEKLMVGKLIASQLHNLIIAYREKIDKNSFYQNLLLDNLLLVDIYNKAQKLHIDAYKPRCVFVIELSAIKDPSAFEMTKELFNSQKGDFVTTVDEDHIVVIKTMSNDESLEDIDSSAKMLVDMLYSEAMTKVRVSYGTIANDIKSVSKTYKEALIALDVGKIFFAEKSVISYSSLGIGRLIYQLPVSLCEMFINEVFGGKLSEDIDDEILGTINKFLDNSLNVSETSRQLYIHRNTLVYRIEKLEKATGLDVRNFDDALTFRIAMMVLGYINYTKDKQ